jgi:hypothetical protein
MSARRLPVRPDLDQIKHQLQQGAKYVHQQLREFYGK